MRRRASRRPGSGNRPLPAESQLAPSGQPPQRLSLLARPASVCVPRPLRRPPSQSSTYRTVIANRSRRLQFSSPTGPLHGLTATSWTETVLSSESHLSSAPPLHCELKSVPSCLSLAARHKNESTPFPPSSQAVHLTNYVSQLSSRPCPCFGTHSSSQAAQAGFRTFVCHKKRTREILHPSSPTLDPSDVPLWRTKAAGWLWFTVGSTCRTYAR